MSTYIDEHTWLKTFQGHIITDCAIRDRNIVYFCLREDLPFDEISQLLDEDVDTRMAAVYLNDISPDFRHGWSGYSGLRLPVVGVVRYPKPRGLLAVNNFHGRVWLNGPECAEFEFIHKGGFPGPERLVCIEGYTWSVGVGRSVYKRVDEGEWVKINKGFPKEKANTDQGFADIAGFSEHDIYAVGGRGDVWHFDGDSWSRRIFPTNQTLNNVVCAPDGYVYIGGEGGSLWRGKDQVWQQIYKGDSTVLWNDMVWFNDQLWLCSDYQLRIWDGKELKRVMDNEKLVSLNGHMDAYDGILVIAGTRTVDLFDGQRWMNIVSPFSFADN